MSDILWSIVEKVFEWVSKLLTYLAEMKNETSWRSHDEWLHDEAMMTKAQVFDFLIQITITIKLNQTKLNQTKPKSEMKNIFQK